MKVTNIVLIIVFIVVFCLMIIISNLHKEIKDIQYQLAIQNKINKGNTELDKLLWKSIEELANAVLSAVNKL